MLKKTPFVMDVMELRKRARRHIEEGSITNSYGSNRETVIKLLNEALATEIICVLRYKRHYFMAKGIQSRSVREEFKEHADQELEHANMLAQRIVEMGGEPDFNPLG